jgi:hypothetical protein
MKAKTRKMRLSLMHERQRIVSDCLYTKVIDAISATCASMPHLPILDTQQFTRDGTEFGGIYDLVEDQARIEIERRAP